MVVKLIREGGYLGVPSLTSTVGRSTRVTLQSFMLGREVVVPANLETTGKLQFLSFVAEDCQTE